MVHARSRRPLHLAAVTLLAAVALLLVAAAPERARAADPPFLGWSSILPPLQGTYEPSSEDDCKRGATSCVDKVIREMTRRFDPLAASCNHDSVFALAYLRTTEEYRRAISDPTFFEDTPFINHQDAVFAEYYFEAYDDWHGGRVEQVPPAWRIAFKAADNKQVSAAGNLFLGMNAHINRDLPFVLYGIGLVKPDGSSRKTDHDKVNVFLNRVMDDLIPEIAARFDPTIDDTNLPGIVDEFLTFQAVPAWREAAWRNAERLANASSAAERERVAADIEAYAAAEAQAFKLATSYGLLGSSASRDSYCAANR
jgi:hypothetical protein